MNWSKKIKTFLAIEEGLTSVEYAVLLAMMAGMMIASIVYVGDEMRANIDSVSTTLEDTLQDE